MNRNTVLSFVDQASGLIEKELGKIEVRFGEIPSINVGEIAGIAIDFLQKNKVPVIGYHTRGAFIVLDHPSKEGSTIKITLLETISIPEKQAILIDAIRGFISVNGISPNQNVKINIEFLYDESQITD
ncbi:MAG: hypothetical protein AAB484_01250 [Patescibacteria group bacterium]